MYRRKPTEYDSDALSQDDLSSIVDDSSSSDDSVGDDREGDSDEVEERAQQLAQHSRPQIFQV